MLGTRRPGCVDFPLSTGWPDSEGWLRLARSPLIPPGPCVSQPSPPDAAGGPSDGQAGLRRVRPAPTAPPRAAEPEDPKTSAHHPCHCTPPPRCELVGAVGSFPWGQSWTFTSRPGPKVHQEPPVGGPALPGSRPMTRGQLWLLMVPEDRELAGSQLRKHPFLLAPEHGEGGTPRIPEKTSRRSNGPAPPWTSLMKWGWDEPWQDLPFPSPSTHPSPRGRPTTPPLPSDASLLRAVCPWVPSLEELPPNNRPLLPHGHLHCPTGGSPSPAPSHQSAPSSAQSTRWGLGSGAPTSCL